MGNDWYYHSATGGVDTVIEAGGTADVIWFYGTIGTEIEVEQSGLNLILYTGSDRIDRVIIENFFASDATGPNVVEYIVDALGTPYPLTSLFG